MEKDGYIGEYTAIPNFYKIGLEIVALSFGSNAERSLTPEQLSKALKWMSEQPEVLCCLDGQGLDSDLMMISVHKNYEAYLAFFRKLRDEPETRTPHRLQTFMVSTAKTERAQKPFSLRKIDSLILPPETQPIFPRQRKSTTQSTKRH